MQKETETLNFSLAAVRNGFCVAAISLLLAACTITGGSSDPSYGSEPPPLASSADAPPDAAPSTTPDIAPSAPPPPGYYRVQLSDTLYRIARDNGRNYRDIAAWNNLTDPNQIQVGQLLRVVPPDGTPPPDEVSAGQALPPHGPADSGVVVGGAISTPPAYSENGNGELQSDSRQPTVNSGSLAFVWPARGPVIGRFDGSGNKGIDIGGAAGEPVRAAAGGKVVYAGNGLSRYGNMIIIKHNAAFLTAYAHNRSLMVREGDTVTRGQEIATMGSTGADRVELHFEVRYASKAVDPLRYLPPK